MKTIYTMHLLMMATEVSPLSWFALRFTTVFKACSGCSISSTKDCCYFSSL